MARKQKQARNNDPRKIKLLVNSIAFILSFALTFSVVLGGILLSAYWENIRSNFSHQTWTYTLGLEEDEYYSSSDISDKMLYIDDVLYLNMTDIAKMCDLTVVGDFNSLTYFAINDSEQTVTFYYDSDKITVNGEHYKMNGCMFESDEQIYIPASFVAQFCSGIIVEVDEEEKTIDIHRHSLNLEYNALDEPYHVYEEITFLTGSIQPIDLPDRGLMFSDEEKNDDGNDER